eukprot:g9983.t1
MSLTPIAVTALRHSAFYSPLLYTIRSGLLEKEGLQAQYAPQTPSTTPAVEQVKSGQADLCQLAVAASFAELERSTEKTALVHFAQINERDGFFLVGRTKDFQWRDLENKEVLVDHLFQPLALMKYACHLQMLGAEVAPQRRDLRANPRRGYLELIVDQCHFPLIRNVDYSKMKVVDAGGPDDMEETFRKGRGDFVHLQGPAAQKLEYEGKGVVVASMGDVIGPVAFSSLYAKRESCGGSAPRVDQHFFGFRSQRGKEWLKTDVARAFMRAYRQGRAATAQLAAKEVAEVVQPFFSEVDPEVLVSTVAVYQKMGCWDGEVEIPKATYEKLLDAFLYSGVISKRHPYDAAIAAVE